MSSQYVTLPETSGGSSAGVSSFNTLTGDVTISAGTNITLTTVGNNIAISASGGGGSGTVTSVSVVSANGFAGSVATATTTPAITLTTSITGVLKGNGTAISAATVGTDYSTGTSALATGILKSTTTTGALTIAIAADFPTLNQNTTGNAATVTTNANLTGPIASSGNTTSITSQTGTGTKFVVDTSPTLVTPVLGVATGTSLALAAGSSSGTSLNFGTAGTGHFGTSTTLNFAVSGSEIARIGASGLSIGTTTNNAPLYVVCTAGGAGISIDDSAGHHFFINATSNEINFNWNSSINFLAYNATSNYVGVGAAVNAGSPGYTFDMVSSVANITPLSTMAFSSAGSSTTNFVVNRNTSSTVNTNAGFGMAGSSKAPMGLIWTTHQVQTAASEQASMSIAVASAGALTQVCTWDHLGNETIPGSYKTSAPQATLTGSAGTAICSQPFQGGSYKKVCVYLSGYTDTGTQTYTYPTAFSQTPYVYGLTAGVSGASASTTAITFTATTLTGFVFVEGY